jgi:membrane protease YdiL (CAAX protease family)
VILGIAQPITEQTLDWNTVLMAGVIGFVVLSIPVYFSIIAKLRHDGGRVRHDLFALSDLLAALVISGMFALTFLINHVAPGTKEAAPPMKPGDVLQGALAIGLFALPGIVLLLARDVNLSDAFGFRRYAAWRGLMMGAVFVAALIPALLLLGLLSSLVFGDKAPSQELVSLFETAARTDHKDMIWRIALSAVVIAPVFEELIFRGYLYPAFKRFLGPFPAGVGTALLFALIHDNAANFAGLALLALALTLAYEWSGSILLPIAMHAFFNALNLAYLWWDTTKPSLPPLP